MSSDTVDRHVYVPAYDGLRFFLLMAALEYHYLYHRVAISKIWFLSYSLPCFFVLSGFLITQLLLRSQSQGRPAGKLLWDFYVSRALRIFPAYYFVVLSAAAILGVPYLVWQLCYVMNFKLFFLSIAPKSTDFIQYVYYWETNGAHLWSMGIEEQFYLLYPPLFVLTVAHRRTALLTALILVCEGCRLILSNTYPNSYYGALLPVAGEYVLWGCLAGWLDGEGRWPWLRHRAVLWGGFLGLVMICCLDHDTSRYQTGQ